MWFWRGKPLMPQVVVDLVPAVPGVYRNYRPVNAMFCPARRQPANYFTRRSALAPDVAPGDEYRLSGLLTPMLLLPPLNNPAVRHALALSINNQRSWCRFITARRKPRLHFYLEPAAYDNDAKITEYNPQNRANS